MKRKLFIFFAIFISLAASSFAQEDNPVVAPTTTPAAVKPAAPAVKPAPPKPKNIDTIRGNAGKEVALIQSANNNCANNMTPMAVTNKSTTRAMKVGVEVLVVFMGKASKKNIIIDNLAPNEIRYVGCSGCIDNTSGKTCTTYKLFAAMYK